MPELATGLRTRVLDGFDDPTFGPDDWDALLASTNSDNVYLTWHWQRAWWEIHPRGRLLLVAAERDGRVVALAPFYAEHCMIYFVGTGFDSGYLDFVGILDRDVLQALLAAARESVRDFVGFRLYFIADTSPTATLLVEAASSVCLSCYEEENVVGPTLDIARRPDCARAAVTKARMLNQERALRRQGVLEVVHFRDGESILPQLGLLFDQIAARWSAKNPGDGGVGEKTRMLVERLTRTASRTGWLRFTRLDWNGRPIALHFGFCYRGRFFYEIPSFAIDMARYSPGLVLIRHLLLSAMEEGVKRFDFGIGEQEYKYRFASEATRVRTYGLYPTRHSRSTEERFGHAD